MKESVGERNNEGRNPGCRTRDPFLPVTKAMPKEMLPLFDRPVIQFVVEEAVQSGITDILIITGRNKRAIEDYFDISPELEMRLERDGKIKELSVIQEVSDLADIHYIRQKEPKGLGDAILTAEKHISGEPFAVLLGDDIVVHKTPCIKQLMERFSNLQSSLVAIEEVPKEKVSSYGILKGNPIGNSLYEMEDIVEKPSIDCAPSRMGAIGRYLFTPEILILYMISLRGLGEKFN
jgi:UTP--glucose-1-phosphate uridylyltransferase